MTQCKIPLLALCLISLITPLIGKATTKTNTYEITTKDGSSWKIKVKGECVTEKQNQADPDDDVYVTDGATLHRFTTLPCATDTNNSIKSREVVTKHLTPKARKGKRKRYECSLYTFIKYPDKPKKACFDPRQWVGAPLLNPERLQALVFEVEFENRNIILPMGAFEVNNTIVYPGFTVHSAVVNEDETITLTGDLDYSTRREPDRNQDTRNQATDHYSDQGVGNDWFSRAVRELGELRRSIRQVESDFDELDPPRVYNRELTTRAEVLLSSTNDEGVLLRRLEVLTDTDHSTPIDGLVVTLVPEQYDRGELNNAGLTDDDKLSDASGVSQCNYCLPSAKE